MIAENKRLNQIIEILSNARDTHEDRLYGIDEQIKRVHFELGESLVSPGVH